MFINQLLNHHKYNTTVEYFSEARMPANQLDDILQEFVMKDVNQIYLNCLQQLMVLQHLMTIKGCLKNI